MRRDTIPATETWIWETHTKSEQTTSVEILLTGTQEIGEKDRRRLISRTLSHPV